MEIGKYSSIIDCLTNKNSIKEFSKIGLCRIWTRTAMDLIKQRFPEVVSEAREVDIEPFLQHTFLKLSIPGEKPILWDGVGTLKFQPFCGFEDEAPAHLQNSKPDMINHI